jgi:hypothetical protein
MAEPITGENGTIKTGESPTELTHVRNWKVTRAAENKAYRTNGTEGFNKRIAGGKDWSGSFDILCEAGALDEFDIGDIVAAEFYANETQKISGSIIIDQIEDLVDIENAEIIGQTLSFSGNGAYTVA